jgi:probable rRNA maturation factor
MRIEINNLTKEKIDFEFLEKFAKKIFKLVKLNISELSVAIVDDKKMIALNTQHKKHNYTTDVLTFNYGEVIICLNQAKRQAKELKHSLKEELGVLLLHGILHLKGYKDETKKDYNKMIIKQEGIWQKIKS